MARVITPCVPLPGPLLCIGARLDSERVDHCSRIPATVSQCGHLRLVSLSLERGRVYTGLDTCPAMRASIEMQVMLRGLDNRGKLPSATVEPVPIIAADAGMASVGGLALSVGAPLLADEVSRYPFSVGLAVVTVPTLTGGLAPAILVVASPLLRVRFEQHVVLSILWVRFDRLRSRSNCGLPCGSTLLEAADLAWLAHVLEAHLEPEGEMGLLYIPRGLGLPTWDRGLHLAPYPKAWAGYPYSPFAHSQSLGMLGPQDRR